MTETLDAKNALQKAVEIAGSQSALAELIGAKQQYVSYWINKGKRIPAEFVLPIEQATDGEVPRHLLRPDIFPAPAEKEQQAA